MTAAPAVLPTQVQPPALELTDADLASIGDVDVLAVATYPSPDGAVTLLDRTGDALGEALGLDLPSLLEHQRATGRAGEVLTAFAVRDTGPVSVLLVGVGEQRPVDYRRAGAALARAVVDRDRVAAAVVAGAPDGALEPFAVGAVLGSFGFHWRSEGPAQRPVGTVVLAGVTEPDADAVLARAATLAGAGWLARTLATVPSNVKDPAWLAGQAEQLAREKGLDCTVWDERELARRGMGGLLAVGRASASPPRLIRLDYTPPGAGRRTPRVVLVGKGITFDTGGLSIKPAEAMTTMKRDMTGGAVVIAVLGALADVGCPVRVTGLVAAAENAVGGDAVRPGDVVTHFGGRTSEVNNTDAEGRLVLADALAWATEELAPAALVDVATLTGAMKVALGQGTGGFFADDDALAESIRAAGERAGEPLWRMPLVRDYEEKLSSRVADADNAPGGPGAITAALFLRPFTGDVPWAHLDVASVGDAPADRHEWSAGPTGYGARALLEWLATEDPLAGVGGR